MTHQSNDDADAGAAAAADDEATLPGTLRTQSGPRTVAPMWARPLLTEGEWAIYTALWSFGTWNGENAWPKHQTLADRAWSERGTVMNAIAKFVKLGLITREAKWRTDKSQRSNEYVLVEVCPDALVPVLMAKFEERQADQAAKKEKRDADKRKYRKRPAPGVSAAETTPGDDDAEAGNDVGSLSSDPTLDGLPDWAQDKGGSSRDVPVTYPSFDLPNNEKSPSTAPVTHAADAPASADAEAPAELAADASASSLVPAVGGKFSPEDQTQLTEAVDAAVAARKTRTGWPRPAVVAAVSEALDAGHPVAVVVAGLAEITKDRATDYPARLAPFLAAKAKRAGAEVPAAPYRHQPAPPCGPDCRCYKHPGPTSGISDDAAAAIAAVRVKLRPGKPLTRSGSWVPTQPTGKAGTAASGDVSTESADTMADA